MKPLSLRGSMALSWLKMKPRPAARPLGAAEYMAARLDSEAAPEELKLALEFEPGGHYVIDARERADYEREHLRGAVSIPLAHLAEWMESLPRDKPLVAYGWDLTCKLALQAALEMTRAGYPARVLIGGIAEWKRKGFPVDAAAPDGRD